MKRFKRILVIPDLHCPFHHVDAFKFLDAVNEKYKPDKVVCLGDEIDGHTISFHDTDPDIPFSPSSELDKAIYHLKDMYVIFPKMDILESNHGSLIYRRAKHHGIPRSAFKDWGTILEAPKGWNWHFELFLQASNGSDIYFTHGLSANALSNSLNRSMNFVQGHHHSRFEIQYWSNGLHTYWGVTAGCLIDAKSMAFSYGKTFPKKPLLGCLMILDGVPVLIPMILDAKGRWTGKII